VLCAVYIPTTFISGLQGSFYQQFSITIAAANVISVFVSLTLSPALAALLLKPRSHEPQPTLADRLAVILPWLAGDPIGVHRVDQSRLQEKLTATRRDFGLAVAFGALSIAEAARPRSGASIASALRLTRRRLGWCRRPVASLVHELVELRLVLGLTQAVQKFQEIALLVFEATQGLAAVFVKGGVAARGLAAWAAPA
jgi:multidrug efflux pump subunit AcrB